MLGSSLYNIARPCAFDEKGFDSLLGSPLLSSLRVLPCAVDEKCHIMMISLSFYKAVVFIIDLRDDSTG